MKYFEAIELGEKLDLGSHTFEAEEIIRYASRYDPQPFHVDEAAAKESFFGSLCASGWHTAAIFMRKMVEAYGRQARLMEMAGDPVARVGPSPGFDELRWLKPVYAGDTVSYTAEVIGKTELRSRPQWGLLHFRSEGLNQADEPVFRLVGYTLIERAPAD
ncbi:MAG: MaoC family dehydratase [Hyphomicrobiales bacterium]|nr:MaoC family dehydratase [Hyphomicrobiales bacterium]